VRRRAACRRRSAAMPRHGRVAHADSSRMTDSGSVASATSAREARATRSRLPR
jgi:hypothetical protein